MIATFVKLPALLAVGAGLVILWRPKILNYVIAIYLLVIGILGLVH
jgi:hypothetical protein